MGGGCEKEKKTTTLFQGTRGIKFTLQLGKTMVLGVVLDNPLFVPSPKLYLQGLMIRLDGLKPFPE